MWNIHISEWYASFNQEIQFDHLINKWFLEGVWTTFLCCFVYDLYGKDLNFPKNTLLKRSLKICVQCVIYITVQIVSHYDNKMSGIGSYVPTLYPSVCQLSPGFHQPFITSIIIPTHMARTDFLQLLMSDNYYVVNLSVSHFLLYTTLR